MEVKMKLWILTEENQKEVIRKIIEMSYQEILKSTTSV